MIADECICEPAVGRGAYRVEREIRRECPIHGADEYLHDPLWPSLDELGERPLVDDFWPSIPEGIDEWDARERARELYEAEMMEEDSYGYEHRWIL